MASLWHMRPTPHVIDSGDPTSRRHNNLPGKKCNAAGHFNTLTRSEMEWMPPALPIKPDGRANGPRKPIDRNVGEKLIPCDSALHITITITPGTELLNNPGGKANGRVIQPIGEALWFCGMKAAIGSFRVKPDRMGGEQRPLLFRQVFLPRGIVRRKVRPGDAI